MKILHVIPSVGPLRGGPSVAIRSITRELAKDGMEVHVCTTDDNGAGRLDVPLGRPIDEEGIKYWYFRRQFRSYTCSLPLLFWLRSHVADYELVHIHSVFSYACTVAAAVARTRGVPYLIRPLGVLNQWGLRNRRRKLKQLSLRLVENPMIRGASLMHYTSEAERLEALQAGIDQRSVVVPNPVDWPEVSPAEVKGEFRASWPDLAGKKIVLFLSRVDRKKGLDVLIEAFPAVVKEHADARLVIAGTGDAVLTKELRERSRLLGMERHILWPGFLAGRMKVAALADADVFVLPSYSENFGNAVLEAMNIPVPVIVSENVPIHREITGSSAGITVPCDAEALASAIARVLSSRDLAQCLATNAKNLAETAFSSASIVARLRAAYESILSEQPGCRKLA